MKGSPVRVRASALKKPAGNRGFLRGGLSGSPTCRVYKIAVRVYRDPERTKLAFGFTDLDIDVTEADNRWALTQVVRLLSAAEGGKELHRAELKSVMAELANDEPALQLARTGASLGIATAIAAELAPALEENHDLDRQELLIEIERLFERRLGLS
jgi:hypothetical protein